MDLSKYPSGNSYVEAYDENTYDGEQLSKLVPLFNVEIGPGWFKSRVRGKAETRSEFFSDDRRRLEQPEVDINTLPNIVQAFLTEPYSIG